MNGLELKRLIDAHPVLRKKSIPFIFYSTATTQNAIEEAYTTLSIQVFFIKENDYHKTKSIVNTVLEYWKSCVNPIHKYCGLESLKKSINSHLFV